MAVLGPVRLGRDGARLAVPAGKTTELLIRLALEAGHAVRSERLIDDLWSESGSRVAPNTLQSKVSKLRRVIGEPTLVTSTGSGYGLVVDPGDVDALEVLRLAGRSTELRASGRLEEAAQNCATALAMFGDEILPDAGDGAWLSPHRARLEEARLQLTEDHLAARLELGDGGLPVAELAALVSEHPLREGLWELLITALYRSGRQADALAAYRRLHQQLDDQLGLEPGVRLQALQQQILQHDPALAPPRRSGGLVGRDHDLASVSRLVGQHSLVTVVGPAGVGKTRLVTELAQTDPSAGRWIVVRLDSVAAASDVWPTIGAAIGAESATEAVVLDGLRGRDVRMILDNCEQLSDGLPEVVGRILQAGTVRILATSQRPLRVDGEVVHLLEPLTVADAAELFVRRAVEVRPSFTVEGGSDSTVEDLCRALDGLPLAIELAAARAKVLSPQEMARRLDDRFTLLRDPNSSRPPRQQALAAALAWSYDLLFPDDQRGLWALGCFSGGAPLEAYEAVLVAIGVPRAAAVDVIDRLVDRSLVSTDVDPAGAVRYRLLDSVRAFSRDRLQESDAADDAPRAHARWYAEAAARADRGVRGVEQTRHLAFVRAERANIDEALTWTRWHDPVVGLQLARGLGWAWIMPGAGVDAAHRLRAAEAAAADLGSPVDRAAALLRAGWLEASGGDLDRAGADIERADSLAGSVGGGSVDDGGFEAEAELYRAFIETVRGRPREALALLAACRPTFARGGQRWEQGASWVMTAWAAVALGDAAGGREACDRALELIRPLGDQWGLGHAEAILGALALAEHRSADAVRHLRSAADAAAGLGFGATAAHHRAELGRALQQSGDLTAASTALRRAVDEAEAVGDLRTAALARVRLARVLRASGELETARACVRSALGWYQAAGGGDDAALAEFVLAALDADEERAEAAAELEAVLDRARTDSHPEIEILTLDRLALLHAAAGRLDEARSALEQARQLLPAVQHRLGGDDRSDGGQARRLITAASARGG